MAQPALTSTGEALPRPEGLQGIVADWSSDQRAFKNVPWGKAMMLTFILISSSGTMVLAVNFGYRKDRVKTFVFLLLTAALGATFVGMQAFEWTKLIVDEGVRPWANPMGAAQFGSSFFMITGFHGTHVSIGG